MDKTVIQLERNVGIDLFRFISMLMVVILHILGHGGILYSGNITGVKYIWVYYLETLAVIAVNCFALISGFVNYKKTFSIKRVLNIWLQVFFINLIVSVLFILINGESFTWLTFLDVVFPVLRKRYWYVSYYFMILLLMPLLNLALKHINKKNLITLLVFIGGLIGISALFCGRFTLFDFGNGYTVTWLAYLYLVGGVVHKYDIKIKFFEKHKIFYLLTYFALSIISLCVSLITKGVYGKHAVLYYTNIFNLINSVLLLMYFANLSLKPNKVINYLSATSFGVYLLHEQPFIRSNFIYKRFVAIAEANSFLIYLSIIMFAMLIYLLCSALEFLRQKLFKFLRINKAVNKIDSICNERFNKNIQVSGAESA